MIKPSGVLFEVNGAQLKKFYSSYTRAVLWIILLITLHFNHFAWWQAVKQSPLFQLACSQSLHILV